jgi:membrane-bound ClpP family serine protease
MEKRNFAFSKLNYILLAVGLAIVIIGFILMSGGSTTEEAFNPDIFSTRRIVVAPMVCLFGFLFVVFAILWRSKSQKEDIRQNQKEKEENA